MNLEIGQTCLAKSCVTHYYSDGEEIVFIGSQGNLYEFTNGKRLQVLTEDEFTVIEEA